MAIYHLNSKVLSRAKGQSVLCAAAYRHGAQMHFELEGRTVSYIGKDEVAHSELLLPDETPTWVRNLLDGRDPVGASEAWWNAVERLETRSNGQLAREIECALPVELTRAQNIELARDFLRTFTERGMVVDWAYHDKDGNPHFHALLSMAPLSEDGFGPKKMPAGFHHGHAAIAVSNLLQRGQPRLVLLMVIAT